MSEAEQESIADAHDGYTGVDKSIEVAMPGTESLAVVLGLDDPTALPKWASRTTDTVLTVTEEGDDSDNFNKDSYDAETENFENIQQRVTGLVSEEGANVRPKMSREMTESQESGPELSNLAGKGKEPVTTVSGLAKMDESKMPVWARGKDEVTQAASQEVGAGDSASSRSGSPGVSDGTLSREDLDVPSMRQVKGWHVSQQTSAASVEQKPGIKMIASLNTETTQEQDFVPHKKMIPGRDVNAETTEGQQARNTRGRGAAMGCTQQSSAEADLVPKKKLVSGQFVSQESQHVERRPLIKIDLKHHPSVQSSSIVQRIPQRNMFGHPSQMSMISNYEIIFPIVKPPTQPPSFSDVDFGCYQIKPNRKRNKEDDPDGAYGVGMNRNMYATKESEYIDFDQKRMDKFKATNVHGHSSDSSVQRLLYGENFGRRGKLVKAESIHGKFEK